MELYLSHVQSSIVNAYSAICSRRVLKARQKLDAFIITHPPSDSSRLSLAMASHLTSLQTLPRSVSAAALKVKEAQQAEYVKQLWLFLAAVIGLLTVINWSTRLLVCLRRRRTILLPSNEKHETSSEKGSLEAPSPGKTGRVSLRRLPVAFASFFRAVVFRTTVPIGPSSVMSVAELVFILGYVAALLTWMWINSKYTANNILELC